MPRPASTIATTERREDVPLFVVDDRAYSAVIVVRDDAIVSRG